MIESTQKKLCEARFFCAKLEHESRTPPTREPEVLEFYLSAFLSAARSVTFALQSEEKQKYDAWFPMWLGSRSPEEKEILKLFRAQRNRVLKEGVADVAPDWALVPVTQLQTSGTPYPAHLLWWGESVPEVGVRILRFDSSLGVTDSDVIPTCTRYITLLDQLVGDFVKAHTSDSGSLTSA